MHKSKSSAIIFIFILMLCCPPTNVHATETLDKVYSYSPASSNHFEYLSRKFLELFRVYLPGYSQKHVVAQTPVPTHPTTLTVYLAGDSTVQTYKASDSPLAGWGQMIGSYFTSDVKFVNKAIGGRSSKNFITEGRLDEILNVIHKGDYLFIQFGHNDATSKKPDCFTDPFTTYKEYLAKYVDRAREKSAIPVLITPPAQLSYENGIYHNDFEYYCYAMKQVAFEKNCAIIDLMTKCLDYYKTLDYKEVYTFYLISSNGKDRTHFTETGATKVARLVAEGVKEINVPISKYVKK